jgi:hypothetical protein
VYGRYGVSLLIMSGQKLAAQLNVNDSFSTIGPGWRANSTIGRAIRLIMINLGYSWPGKADMKSYGSPFKYVTLMAENEGAYSSGWEPIRVAEGFDYDQPTLSLMPAVSWQPQNIGADLLTADRIIDELSKQGTGKYDNSAATWGMDNLVILSPSTFDAVRREGLSRIDMQKALYELVQLPCSEFFEGRDPSKEVGTMRTPEWIVQKCSEDPEALVPLLAGPQSIKIVIAGAPGPAIVTYVGTWGWGPSYFVTKPIMVPKNWDNLLEKYKGWKTPVVR